MVFAEFGNGGTWTRELIVVRTLRAADNNNLSSSPYTAGILIHKCAMSLDCTHGSLATDDRMGSFDDAWSQRGNGLPHQAAL